MKNNIISVDFDGTLNDHFSGAINPIKKIIRDWVMRLIRRGYDVRIVTRRYDKDHAHLGALNEHLEVYKIASELGISEDKVFFTNRDWKYQTISDIEASIHIDDDVTEKYWLERHSPDVQMIWLEDKQWEDKLIETIDKHDHLKIWLSNEKNILKAGLILAITLLGILIFN